MTRPLRPPTHELPRVFSREEGNAVEEALLGIVTTINNYLSNYILIILLLGMGIWFTVRTKAIQFRCFGEGWRRVFGDFSLRGGNQGGGMTSFQALSTAIAAQVGTGNIVGACGAIIALAFIFMGSLLSNDLVWELADMFNQLMVIPNAIALFALSGAVLAIANAKHDKRALDAAEERLEDQERAAINAMVEEDKRK